MSVTPSRGVCGALGQRPLSKSSTRHPFVFSFESLFTLPRGQKSFFYRLSSYRSVGVEDVPTVDFVLIHWFMFKEGQSSSVIIIV